MVTNTEWELRRYRLVCTRRRPLHALTHDDVCTMLGVERGDSVHVLTMHPDRDEAGRCRWCGEEMMSLAVVL